MGCQSSRAAGPRRAQQQQQQPSPPLQEQKEIKQEPREQQEEGGQQQQPAHPVEETDACGTTACEVSSEATQVSAVSGLTTVEAAAAAAAAGPCEPWRGEHDTAVAEGLSRAQSEPANVLVDGAMAAVPGTDTTFAEVVSNGWLALASRPTPDAMRCYADADSTLVVTLLGATEGAAAVGEACRACGVQWLQLDFWAQFHSGQLATIRRYAQHVAVLLSAGGGTKVVVHCSAGLHRTGLFGFAVLRALGLPHAAALGVLRRLSEGCSTHLSLTHLARLEAHTAAAEAAEAAGSADSTDSPAARRV